MAGFPIYAAEKQIKFTALKTVMVKKNEGRKEKWIKKKLKKDRGDYLGHVCGEDYRVKNGYMKKQNLFVVDVFSNWSDADSGLPGPSTAMQRVRKLKKFAAS